MIYRKAIEKDLEEVIFIKNKVKERIIKKGLPIWKNGYPLDSFLEEDIMHDEARVVEVDGCIVAYSCFLPTEKEYGSDVFKKDNLYSFGRIMVRDGYTGKGIGDFLVKSMIEETKSLGANGMGILVDSCNEIAVNLYQKHGFKKEGEREFPFAYLDIYGLYFE